MKKILALVLALCMVLPCFAMAETADTYTYNGALSTFPTTWNPHQYKTETDNSAAMTWVSDSLYDFDYNDTLDGYRMEARMAVGEPVDVTAEYVGEKWGIAEGDTGRAWKYTLRNDLKWQDGTPINAETFVDSVAKQLNPVAANYRADSLYAGSTVIANAEGYAKQGQTSPVTFASQGATIEGIDAWLAEHGTEKGYINWNYTCGDTWDFENKVWTGSAVDEVVETPLTVAELWAFYTEPGQPLYEYVTWADDAGKKAYALDELQMMYTFPAVDVADIGVQAVSELEVVFILEKSLEGFQLKYNLSVPLVHKEMYEKCETITDGVYNNTYNTSAETTMSYGPYMMTSFQSDKEIVFEKNPYWWGWNDPEFEGSYQTTHVRYDYVENPETAFEMFLAGKLDSRGLDVDRIEEYASSDYTYYSEGASVFAMTFNPDLEALTANQAAAGENINKTIITLKEFRMAMSLGINRSEFIFSTSPTNAPAFALYGGTIVGDPETGAFYRDSEDAKSVIVDFWGLTEEVGEGKMYATKDEAIESISGYNLEMAREYFNKAYDIAIEIGLMDEDDVVQIIVGIPSPQAAFYNNGYDYIVNNYTEAVKGTKLEGKLTFTRDDTIGNGFGDALRNNQVDMLFGVGWSGSTFDPYGLMEAYVSANYQYDAAVDYNNFDVTIEINGKSYTTAVWNWYLIMNNYPTEVAAADGSVDTLVFPYSRDAEVAATRQKILAALEGAVLQNYNFIPLMNDASATLKGMQIEYYTEEEVFPMGYGGVRYYTYNYTDAEWDAFVAEQGGVLNYK